MNYFLMFFNENVVFFFNFLFGFSMDEDLLSWTIISMVLIMA
jgi:hypothetical protein